MEVGTLEVHLQEGLEEDPKEVLEVAWGCRQEGQADTKVGLVDMQVDLVNMEVVRLVLDCVVVAFPY